MSVLSRAALEASPLADLHAIASELGIDGFRRLRKADLVDRIVAHQGGDDGESVAENVDEVAAEPEAARAAAAAQAAARPPTRPAEVDAEDEAEPRTRTRPRPRPRRRRSRPTSGRGARAAVDATPTRRSVRAARARRRTATAATAATSRDGRDGRDGDRDEETAVEGVVELLANGSGFLRLDAPRALRRRRLHLGRPGAPLRARHRRPRRRARSASRGARSATRRSSASTPSTARRPTRSPRARRSTSCPARSRRSASRCGGDDPTLSAIEWLTPIGRGSRVDDHRRPALAGKTEALRRLAVALSGREGARGSASCSPGVRPEEAAEWTGRPGRADRAPTLAAGAADAQAQAIERAVETAKRIAARGGHAVVAHRQPRRLAPGRGAPRAGRGARHRRRRLADRHRRGRRARWAARRRSSRSTPARTGAGRFPALDLAASGTLRPERLVGDAGRAKAIAAGARRGRWRSASARHVGDPAPGGLGRQLDGLAAAVGLDVGEGLRSRRRSATSSSPSLTRWSSHAERKTRRRSQCTSERSLGPTSSGQQSLTCSPSADAGSWISPLTARFTRSSSSRLVEPSGRRSRACSAACSQRSHEVALVERESEFAVLEDEVLAGVVVAAGLGVHDR